MRGGSPMLRKYNTQEVDKVVNPRYNTHIDTKEKEC